MSRRRLPTHPGCTVAKLVRVLRAAPRPDSSYLGTLEKLTRRQPKLPSKPRR